MPLDDGLKELARVLKPEAARTNAGQTPWSVLSSSFFTIPHPSAQDGVSRRYFKIVEILVSVIDYLLVETIFLLEKAS